jgi:hypothetical protein
VALFAFAVASFVVGRAAPEIVVKEKKVRRAGFLLSLPAVCAAIALGSYALWGKTWLAIVLASTVGPFLHAVVTWLVVPDLARKHGPGFEPPQRGDLGYCLYRWYVTRRGRHGGARHA